MNCEDYKLAITADPAFDGGTEHVAECADCSAYAGDIRALNLKIAKAMALAVPKLSMPELPDVDNSNVVSLNDRRSVSKPVWLAIAASVLLAAFVGLRVGDIEVPHQSLGDQLLAHMDHEPYALKVSSDAVSDARLTRVVPANVATMNHNSGLITYAQSCVINGHDVPHLVIQGKKGPITILLMPEEALETAEEIIGKNIQGVILPVGGGSIAIIGDSEEQLEDVKSNVLESVNWST